IRKQPYLSHDEINRSLGTNINDNEPFILLIKHPLSSEVEKAQTQMEITLQAVVELGIQTIIIYPNSDAGSFGMITEIERYTETYSFLEAFKALPRDIFVNLQRKAALLLGSSSCGLLEAPFLWLPVVNVGN